MIKIVKDGDGTWCVGTKGLGGYLLLWAIKIAIAVPLAVLFCKYVVGV